MSKRKGVRQETIQSATEESNTAETVTTIDATAGTSTEGQIGCAASQADGENDHNLPIATIRPTATYRFALLAASVAFAAALGGLIGSLSTYGLTAPKSETSDAARGLQAALTQVSNDVAALKATFEASNRAATTQVSKITERFNRSERAQAEPAAEIAASTGTVAKLEQRRAAMTSDITGSIPDRAAAKEPPKPPIVDGWVLRDIYRGRALLENRHALYEVIPGANLPGVGRVESITQQNGRWVVVTPKGLIVSMR